MVCKMNTILNAEKKNIIDSAKAHCKELGIDIVLTHNVSDEVLESISERSKAIPKLYFVSVDMLKSRLENGCFFLKKGDELIGHIFAHKHQVKDYSVYERSSLWVHKDYRSYNLGLLLMHLMTGLYENDFLISIAQTSKVHYYNELLGMTHVRLAEMSTVLVDELEKIGKLRDELNYKYFVNAYFESEIRELK